MAKIVLGLGMSHSPVMAMDGKYWADFAKSDSRHPLLFDETGKHVTFEELNAQRGGPYSVQAQPENLRELYEAMKKAFGRLKDDLAQANPDILVVISNDHPGEFIDESNVPALAIFYGDKVISVAEEDRTKKLGIYQRMAEVPDALQQMTKGMGMDKNNVWPGSRKVGLHLIDSLIEQGFDVGALKESKKPAKNGHGHGFGMVVTELMNPEQLIPMVPVYLNTLPPNEIPPSRCYDLGRALRTAIEAMPDDLRVAVVASGGLSHFVTNVSLDQLVLKALRTRSEHELRNIPRHLLKAGNSEIRNWVILAAAVEHLQMDWDQYLPMFRTPSGTGIGMTFAKWE
ncbi:MULTISPECIES: hypothetical protein [unclassified Paenibacillus]|uniref:DODA-type extradiol aromatic ring-opening family dioxygenase n=1 Tax=unclassified Paenibacillus TaxID=185978 RepID=UPI001AE47084|nr:MULTISPECIES: hypothetical protein [unclassified Paenibacillus]MBP1155403.1 3-O-methylgallate 3,4-dioxygenase [Paenibacillus sp. PvP091]MBP1169212.1 3-O-methylgallate 3,4-dioxygenase [Paenibacillus sp. PvR098]MBP2440240.1 3-O-methylgallate 3,4-dioxygenase [Paenibacillus sp. PvP052]